MEANWHYNPVIDPLFFLCDRRAVARVFLSIRRVLMRLITIALILFLQFMWEQRLIAQIASLESMESSQSRLDQYLMDADEEKRVECLVFRVSLMVISKAPGSEEPLEIETTGVKFHDKGIGAQYSSNHVASSISPIPNRSEMFRLNGKEKSKQYGVSRENANGQEVDVEPDPSGKRAPAKNAFHAELEGLVLPVSNPIAFEGRISNINEAVRYWVTNNKLQSEEKKGTKLVSRWLNSNQEIASEIVFDDLQGGMPVLMRDFTVDKQGKQIKEYFAETKTVWKKVSTEEEESKDFWVPSRLEGLYKVPSERRHYTVELEWIKPTRAKELFADLNWKVLFDTPKTNWFGNITKVIIEESQSASKSKSRR